MRRLIIDLTRISYVYSRGLQRRSFSHVINLPEYSWLKELGLKELNEGVYNGSSWSGSGAIVEAICPSNNESIARVQLGTVEECSQCIVASKKAWAEWGNMPGPQRGEIVRQRGEQLRKKKNLLGRLVSLEVGKIIPEGQGEIQEIVDVCDFATGLSRTFTEPTIMCDYCNELLKSETFI